MKELLTNPNNETEKVYVPRRPELLDTFRHESGKRIIQPYLSDPSEPYSLRLRATEKAGTLKFDTTLKSAGEIVADGKSRDEYTAVVSESRFGYYTTDELPTVYKKRVSPLDKIDIDFFDDGDAWIESEDPAAWNLFLDRHGLSDSDFEDMTGRVPDNETRAHELYRRMHEGRSAFRPYQPFDVDLALEGILQATTKHSRSRLPVVRLYGRSGSGKSRYLSDLRKGLEAHNVPSAVISTDDYNIGTTALTRINGGEHPTNFDTADVYDLGAAWADALRWLHGIPIVERKFDFATSEPKYGEQLAAPADGTVLFIEGLWARHPNFDAADVTYDVATPLATSLGQRITRDTKDRPEFADPSKNLAYYLEHAEPTYRAQSRITPEVQ